MNAAFTRFQNQYGNRVVMCLLRIEKVLLHSVCDRISFIISLCEFIDEIYDFKDPHKN